MRRTSVASGRARVDVELMGRCWWREPLRFVVARPVASDAGLRSAGYQHTPQIEGEKERAMDILPHIHIAFSNLKTWLLGTHHGSVQQQHMQAYLNEFT